MNANNPLAALPSELIDAILDLLEKKDWKSIRLISPILTSQATAKLFDRFTLYSHEKSFQKLEYIAGNETIRHFVTKLDFDGRFNAILGINVGRFRSVWSKDIKPEERSALFDEARELYRGRLEASSIIDTCHQFSTLKYVLPKLSNLMSISTYDVHPARHLYVDKKEIPPFYQEFLNATCNKFPHSSLNEEPLMLAYDHSEQYSQIMLSAMQQLSQSLHTLALYDIDFTSTMSSGISKHRDKLEGLISPLKQLTIRNEHDLYMEAETSLIHLTSLLKAAVNVTDLVIVLRDQEHLDLDSDSLYDCSLERIIISIFSHHPHNRISATISPQLIWSTQLTSLEIGGISCSLSEIREVLGVCTSTLRKLTLSGLLILPEQPSNAVHLPETPRACLVRLFQWISESFSLTEFCIQSRISNLGMQHWIFYPWPASSGRSPPSQTGDMLSRLQFYILHGGPNPLQRFAIEDGYFDLRRKTISTPAPIQAVIEEGLTGDDQFHVVYDHFRDHTIERTFDSDEVSGTSDDSSFDGMPGVDSDLD